MEAKVDRDFLIDLSASACVISLTPQDRSEKDSIIPTLHTEHQKLQEESKASQGHTVKFGSKI